MTVLEAVQEVQKVGTIRAEAGRLRVRFPAEEEDRIRPALDVLKRERDTALSLLGGLKGRAVELWHDGMGRLWIVEDEEDAAQAMALLGANRGEVWTPAEVERVAVILDPAIRLEVAQWKKQFEGTITAATLHAGIGGEPRPESGPYRPQSGGRGRHP